MGDFWKDLGDLWERTWEEFCEEWREQMESCPTTTEVSLWVLWALAWYIYTC